MTDHAALIARLEAASEGSRELDKEIGSALGWRYRHVDGYLQYIAGDRWDGPSGVTLGDLPRWSTSLDDALAHVMPEGWAWSVHRTDVPECTASAQVWIPAQRTRGLRVERCDCHNANTPALALCIAALRAKEAGQEGEA